MLRSMKVWMAGLAITLSMMSAGSAFAQGGEAGSPDQPAAGMGEIGVVLDYAYAQPAFREALKSGDRETAGALLVKYGMREDVPLTESPMDTIVPLGPYNNCSSILVTYYEIGGWPNHPLMKWIKVCDNSAGGQTAFGW